MQQFILLKSVQFEEPVFCFKDDNLIAVRLRKGKIVIYDLIKMKNVTAFSANDDFAGFYVVSDYFCNLNLLSNGNILIGSNNGMIREYKIFE